MAAAEQIEADRIGLRAKRANAPTGPRVEPTIASTIAIFRSGPMLDT